MLLLCTQIERRMEIILLVVGATNEAYVQEGLALYSNRLQRYSKYSMKVVASREKQLSALQPGDVLVLLDERGPHYTSRGFSQQLQKWMNQGPKRLVFAVGDAYGFSDEFRAASQASLALGEMTFPHDLVRLIFAEQLYRAWTILHDEPYHHR
jgi:23S rRNA (pseudouridine1915-N3)-methyltransferase